MMDTLPDMLSRLKLISIRDRLDNLLDEASRKEMTFRETLAFLCEQEIASKDDRRIQMGFRLAKFPYLRTLDQFDFKAQPSIDPRQIRDLSACRWIAHGDALLFQGPPGVGKTHLAVALGREAICRGYSVLFTSATSLAMQLVKVHNENQLSSYLSILSKPKLLIIDELGYLPFDPRASHLFFQLVSERYERGSLLITSNRSVSEWGTIFGDDVVATAILDRLLHHSHVVTIRGESYRLREKRQSGLVKPRAESKKEFESPPPHGGEGVSCEATGSQS